MSFTSVDEYLNSLNGIQSSAVCDFIAFMQTEFQKLAPKILYSMPMWCTGAKMYDGYVAVSAAEKHYCVHFLDENYIDKLKEMLPDCKFGKRCVNIKYGDDKSVTVVKKAVKVYISSIM